MTELALAPLTADWLRQLHQAGVECVNISPMRSDAADLLDAAWLAVRPNTDTVLMLGLAHTLLVEGRHDEAFLARYCVGFERFRAYLLGHSDGQPKDASWAVAITEIPAERIQHLARRMAAVRTMITVSWSLQRADHGEQPYWAAMTLAAMLGQLGLPGGQCSSAQTTLVEVVRLTEPPPPLTAFTPPAMLVPSGA